MRFATARLGNCGDFRGIGGQFASAIWTMMHWANCRHHDDDGDASPAPNGSGERMKRKTLAAGLLSLCLLGISTSQVAAGIFDCWCRHKYTTQITCRPYNAFTPICWGNLVCDGCCPNPCGCASGCLPMTMGVPPWACQGGGCGMPPPCMGGGCGMPGGFGMGGPEGGCCASDMGPMMAGPPMRPGLQPMPMACRTAGILGSCRRCRCRSVRTRR